jgi:serine/threonine-protein kinase
MRKNFMGNIASNLPIIQALQAQSQQLLPFITQTLSEWQYSEIVHQRISQQSTDQTQDSKMQSIKQSRYQGLTRATHSQFGSVMIKWELYAKGVASHTLQSISDLAYEITALKALHILQKIQPNAIAPSVLAYRDVEVQVSEQRYQLTVLVIPYYENSSLAKQLNRQQYSLLADKQKHHFIVQSAHLVCALHKVGWLHNDIKPSNILLSDTSTDSADSNDIMPDLILTDFALAWKIDKPRGTNSAGTPAYLAPERWQRQRVTVQSDIYAFGIMMVEILVGKRPFNIDPQSNQSMTDWAIQHCQQPIPKLPIDYVRYQCIVDKALAKRVEKRYQSMDKLLKDL